MMKTMWTGWCPCERGPYGLLLVHGGKVRRLYVKTPCDICLIERFLNASCAG